jgi:hypothetical protein
MKKTNIFIMSDDDYNTCSPKCIRPPAGIHGMQRGSLLLDVPGPPRWSWWPRAPRKHMTRRLGEANIDMQLL